MAHRRGMEAALRRRPLGMRVQLAAAMVALAVLSVAVAGLLIHRAAAAPMTPARPAHAASP